MTKAAGESGALTIAITNVIDSDLANASDFPIEFWLDQSAALQQQSHL